MGCITSEHKETKKKKKKRRSWACMSPGTEKRRKEPQETLVSWAWCPPVVPFHFVGFSFPSCVVLSPFVPSPFVVVSSPSFSSSHPHHSPLAVHHPHVPVVVVHPWSTLRAVAHSSGGGCWVAFIINSSSIYLKRFRNKNIKRE